MADSWWQLEWAGLAGRLVRPRHPRRRHPARAQDQRTRTSSSHPGQPGPAAVYPAWLYPDARRDEYERLLSYGWPAVDAALAAYFPRAIHPEQPPEPMEGAIPMTRPAPPGPREPGPIRQADSPEDLLSVTRAGLQSAQSAHGKSGPIPDLIRAVTAGSRDPAPWIRLAIFTAATITALVITTGLTRPAYGPRNQSWPRM